LDGFDAHIESKDAIGGEGHGDAIEQVFAQGTFLGVVGGDEEGFAGMLDADSFPLDDVATFGENAEEEVGDFGVEEVDFIDVEDAAMGFGEESGLEDGFAFLHGLFDIDGPQEPVFGDVEGDLHEGGGDDLGVEVADVVGVVVTAVGVMFEGDVVPLFGAGGVAVTDGLAENFDGGK
jgi:hypothetical protein